MLRVVVCVALLLAVAYASECSVGALSGMCVSQGEYCEGRKFATGCGDDASCCVSEFGSCRVNDNVGVCRPHSHCMGTLVSSSECGDERYVDCCLHENVTSPFLDAQATWTRDNCQQVAQAWLANKVKYSWSPSVKQFITTGPGPYRTDCSGFVSASWNINPPGAVTASFPHVNIERCDALLKVGKHIALFWGWESSGHPIVVEECGHTTGCCGSEANCPGACGTAANCNEYCPGCPIKLRTWSSLNGYQPVRRSGW